MTRKTRRSFSSIPGNWKNLYKRIDSVVLLLGPIIAH